MPVPEAAEQVKQVESGEVEAPIIPGTSYKTPEEAAKGYMELKALVDRQGNELGMTRKQLEQATKLIEKSMSGTAGQDKAKQAPPASPDFDAELVKIDKAIESLDVDDPSYGKQLAQLNKQARALEAQKVQTMTEQKLISQFQQTLSERDAQQAQQSWKSANPDFETPEMQQAIQMHIAQDKTGMMDPVLAYREIQLQQTAAQMKQLQAENEDFRNRLKLKSGEAAVGKVVTKTGGQPGAVRTTAKATGAALDEGLRSAFRNAS